jgi:V8-like Glu-specific endopeptidase
MIAPVDAQQSETTNNHSPSNRQPCYWSRHSNGIDVVLVETRATVGFGDTTDTGRFLMRKFAKITGVSLFTAYAVLAQLGCDEGSTTQVTSAVNADIYVGGKKMIWVRSVPETATTDSANVQARSSSTSLTPTSSINTNNMPRLSEGASLAGPTVDSMSLDDLAEALRPLMLANGQEYRGAEPDYDTARALKSHKLNGAIGQPSAAIASIATSPHSQLLPSQFVEKTSDTRQPVNNLTFPGAENAAVITYNDGDIHYINEGSATIIGPHTAISAAHVFYDRTNKVWNTWAAGFVAPGNLDGGPYGYFNTNNCMTITISSNYPTWPITTEQWDFAVLDFASCTGANNPSYYVGYIGYWWGWASNTTPSDVLSIWGSPDPAANCTWPHECGMTGTWSSVSGWSAQSAQIFAGSGQSGVSMALNQSGNIYHVATFVATVTQGSQYLYALSRVFDGVVYGYCHTLDPSRFP